MTAALPPPPAPPPSLLDVRKGFDRSSREGETQAVASLAKGSSIEQQLSGFQPYKPDSGPSPAPAPKGSSPAPGSAAAAPSPTAGAAGLPQNYAAMAAAAAMGYHPGMYQGAAAAAAAAAYGLDMESLYRAQLERYAAAGLIPPGALSSSYQSLAAAYNPAAAAAAAAAAGSSPSSSSPALSSLLSSPTSTTTASAVSSPPSASSGSKSASKRKSDEAAKERAAEKRRRAEEQRAAKAQQSKSCLIFSLNAFIKIIIIKNNFRSRASRQQGHDVRAVLLQHSGWIHHHGLPGSRRRRRCPSHRPLPPAPLLLRLLPLRLPPRRRLPAAPSGGGAPLLGRGGGLPALGPSRLRRRGINQQLFLLSLVVCCPSQVFLGTGAGVSHGFAAAIHPRGGGGGSCHGRGEWKPVGVRFQVRFFLKKEI